MNKCQIEIKQLAYTDIQLITTVCTLLNGQKRLIKFSFQRFLIRFFKFVSRNFRRFSPIFFKNHDALHCTINACIAYTYKTIILTSTNKSLQWKFETSYSIKMISYFSCDSFFLIMLDSNERSHKKGSITNYIESIDRKSCKLISLFFSSNFQMTEFFRNQFKFL